MDPLVKTLYLYFYKKEVKAQFLKYTNVTIPSSKSIERLFYTAGARVFVERHVAYGSTLYFKLLELKSKEVREEWGREAIFHSRNLKNVRRKKTGAHPCTGFFHCRGSEQCIGQRGGHGCG